MKVIKISILSIFITLSNRDYLSKTHNMKLQEFSNVFILLTLFFIITFFSSCDRSKIYMKYHFFSITELEDIYIDIDAVIKFQENVAKCETFDVFKQKQRIYSENDTVKFLSETGDTIKARRVSSIEISNKSDELAISPETLTNIGYLLFSIDSDIFSILGYGKIKESIDNNVVLINNFGIVTQGVNYSIDKLSSGAQKDAQITKENYSYNNIMIENCYFVRFFDQGTFKIQLVYSSHYGFLQIKNTQHEINRIL